MQGCIYLITNTSNSKKYVGQTNKNPIARWNSHVNSACNLSIPCNPLSITHALRNEPAEYFNFDVIDYGEEGFELTNLENAWIAILRTYKPEFGYNIKFTNVPDLTDLYNIQNIQKKSKWPPPGFRFKIKSEQMKDDREEAKAAS